MVGGKKGHHSETGGERRQGHAVVAIVKQMCLKPLEEIGTMFLKDSRIYADPAEGRMAMEGISSWGCTDKGHCHLPAILILGHIVPGPGSCSVVLPWKWKTNLWEHRCVPSSPRGSHRLSVAWSPEVVLCLA